MSAELKRHIGKLKNSDRRCVIVYMQIPNRTDHALIIDTDSLSDQFHQFLMDVVESESAQHSVNLADVLDRRASPDAGMNLMNSFHARGYLRPERIDNIIMLPRPNMPFPLAKLIELSSKKPVTPVAPVQEPTRDRFNQHTENLNADAHQSQLNLAKSILMDAKLLEEEAARKKAKAYELAPSLRPVTSTIAYPTMFASDAPMAEDIPIASLTPDILNTDQDSLEQREMQLIVEQAQNALNLSVNNSSEQSLPKETKPKARSRR